MTEYMLFISRKEKTNEEAYESLKQFSVNTDIPETFFARLDSPAIIEDFNFEKTHYSQELLDILYEKYYELTGPNPPKGHIDYFVEQISIAEAVLNDDIEAWVKTWWKDCYTVRDGNIYTTKNLWKGFCDGIAKTGAIPCAFLTDEYGNKVEGSYLRHMPSIAYCFQSIYCEYTDTCIRIGYGKELGEIDNIKVVQESEFIKLVQEIIDNATLDDYVRIIPYELNLE